MTNIFKKTINPFFHEAKIGVVGFGESGKTVFLTSLLNHILHHDPDKFKIAEKGNTQIVGARENKFRPEKAFAKEFEYSRNRKRITDDRQWPERTVDCSKFNLRFLTKKIGKNKDRLSHYNLTLYDIPGERLADIDIYKGDYNDWSKRQIELLEEYACDPKIKDKQAILDYVNLTKSPTEGQAAQIVSAYRKALACLWGKYGHFVTPSYFALDGNGKRLESRVTEFAASNPSATVEEKRDHVAMNCASGKPNEEFAPLPENRIDGVSESLAKQFEAHYKKYKSDVVKPIFSTLKNCNGLVLLLDIANIIQNGPHLYNDYTHMIKDIFEALKPTTGIIPDMLSKTAGVYNLRRVAFVASQCDRFHPDDWGCLEGLANGLANPIQQTFPDAQCRTFVCSAVLSAGISDMPDTITELKNPGTGGGIEHKVHSLTNSSFNRGWPGKWNTDGIVIPKIAPYMPSIQTAVPEQHQLDNVFRYITGWFNIHKSWFNIRGRH